MAQADHSAPADRQEVREAIEVLPYEDSHRAQWDEFACSRADSSFSHLSAWGRVIEQALGHEQRSLMAVQGDQVRGILPLFQVRSRLFGRFLVSAPAANSAGLLAADEVVKAKLLDAARGLATSLNVDYAEFRQEGYGLTDLPSDDSYVTTVVPLDADPDSLRKRIANKVRRDLNRARRDGLSVVYGHDLLGDFYSLYREHMRRLGSPAYGRPFFEAICTQFPDTADVVVVRQGGRSVAANIAIRHAGRISNLFAGAEPDAMKSGAISRFCWDQIERGCRMGLKSYDLGRSTRDSSSHHYKQYWRGDDVPLPYCYLLHRASTLPDKHATSPRYRLAVAIWKKLPACVTDRLGPAIVKYLH